jgi:CRP/FNR family transcriptional regulator, cyclic AMP receptor protein
VSKTEQIIASVGAILLEREYGCLERNALDRIEIGQYSTESIIPSGDSFSSSNRMCVVDCHKHPSGTGPSKMLDLKSTTFDAVAFLAKAGLGRRIVQLNPKEAFFSQGTPADSIFYLQKGRAKLTVVSKNGKEATITLLSVGDFVGEESLASVGGVRLATATAITACMALKIEREEMVRVMHQEHAFSDLFLKFLLARSMRTQADLIDQLFNSSERRLARILLLMAEFGMPGEPEPLIPPITQETLAEMIGTTRSRVSFFMNRFRKLGLIEYNGRIRVHKTLLNVVLHDELPEQNNAEKPPIGSTPRNHSRPSTRL